MQPAPLSCTGMGLSQPLVFPKPTSKLRATACKAAEVPSYIGAAIPLMPGSCQVSRLCSGATRIKDGIHSFAFFPYSLATKNKIKKKKKLKEKKKLYAPLELIYKSIHLFSRPKTSNQRGEEQLPLQTVLGNASASLWTERWIFVLKGKAFIYCKLGSRRSW